jgi:ubiquinone/menaquinone biosynthesis C-methylase UbiE
MDPEEYRAESRERWTSVAAGWDAQRERMSNATEPVTRWLVDALELAPGKTVLELACGPGEVGLTAVERVRPGGRLIATDTSEAMVELVRERAAQLGFDDVEARVMDAEWLDLPTASVDAIVCRWGFMLLADPGASLVECRRVLRPGGRVSLAAWAGAEHNPWSSAIGAELVARGLFERPAPGEPGQFAWADTAVITGHLEDAGFVEPRVETVEFTFDYPDLDDWWDVQLDLSPMLGRTVGDMSPADRDDLREALDARLREYVRDDGTVTFPAATHVAAAEA